MSDEIEAWTRPCSVMDIIQRVTDRVIRSLRRETITLTYIQYKYRNHTVETTREEQGEVRSDRNCTISPSPTHVSCSCSDYPHSSILFESMVRPCMYVCTYGVSKIPWIHRIESYILESNDGSYFSYHPIHCPLTPSRDMSTFKNHKRMGVRWIGERWGME